MVAAASTTAAAAIGSVAALALIHAIALAAHAAHLNSDRAGAHSTSAVAPPSPPRHVVFFVIDDLGYSDLGYRHETYPNVSIGTPFPTPAIDALAMGGVRLERHYVHQLCSPSRTSALSGRYASTIGQDGTVIVDGHAEQMPLTLKTIGDHLSENGWATSAYGKYDAGMTSWGCTPTCRGFQHFSGFYNAFNDYFSHRVGPGLDLRLDTAADMASGNWTGHYYTEMLTDRVIEWITDTVKKNASQPTFAYVAQEANHAPDEVPMRYITGTSCNSTMPLDWPTRRMSCGMIAAVDESVANITNAYKSLGIWDDTIVILIGDNGGNPQTGGANWPLRGQKATTFEGGVREIGFASGAGLSPAVKGSVNTQLMHVSDWLPTIVEGIAGIQLTNESLRRPGMPAPPPLDGFNQWPLIADGAGSRRTEILLNLNPTDCRGNCSVRGQSALLQIDQKTGKWWKLLYGFFVVWGDAPSAGNYSGMMCVERCGKASPSWTLPVTAATSSHWCPAGWTPPPSSGKSPVPPPEIGCTNLPCNATGTFLDNGGILLFDVMADPYEQHNLAQQYPQVVSRMIARIKELNATTPVQQSVGVDPLSSPAKFGGVWTPWRGDPDPSKCSTDVAPGPGSQLKSNFDGLTVVSGVVSAAGWCWDAGTPSKGIAPLTIVVRVDGVEALRQVANIDRPGLVNKTGAPNPNHGFDVMFNASVTGRMSHGLHRVSVFAIVDDAGLEVEIAKSPACIDNMQPRSCPHVGGQLPTAVRPWWTGDVDSLNADVQECASNPLTAADSRRTPCHPGLIEDADRWL